MDMRVMKNMDVSCHNNWGYKSDFLEMLLKTKKIKVKQVSFDCY